jgi:hypothetical protein
MFISDPGSGNSLYLELKKVKKQSCGSGMFISDPGSGSNPDPRSRGQKGTRIPDSDPQHRIGKEFKYFLSKKLLLSSQIYDSRIFSITYPVRGFRGQKSTGSQIRNKEKDDSRIAASQF